MSTENTQYMIISILIMTGITYLLRALPLVIFRKKIKSQFIQSFLFYVPYAVLSAMAFPAIFTATGNVIASVIGSAVAIVLAFTTENLMIVALGSAVAAYVAALVI